MFRIVAFLALFATTAHATNITLLGVGAFTGSSTTPRAVAPVPTFDGKWTFGGGVSFLATNGHTYNLEIGALYIPRKYVVLPGTEAMYHVIELPVMMRFTFIPVLSLGLGGFFTFRIADDTNGVGPGAGMKSIDFGAVGAVGAEFPVGPAAFIVEVRYALGIADLDPDPVGTWYTRTWQFLGGVRFGL